MELFLQFARYKKEKTGDETIGTNETIGNGTKRSNNSNSNNSCRTNSLVAVGGVSVGVGVGVTTTAFEFRCASFAKPKVFGFDLCYS